jgi:hypothetical protein
LLEVITILSVYTFLQQIHSSIGDAAQPLMVNGQTKDELTGESEEIESLHEELVGIALIFC